MRKSLLSAIATGILLVGTQSAIAQPGPYVGVAIGGNQGSWSTHDNTSTTYSFSSRGVIGTVFGGFAFNPNPFYIGFEAFLNQASNKSSTKTINAGTVNRYARQKYSYGISMLPGFSIADFAIIYARAGVVRTVFQVKDVTTTLPTISLSSSPTLNGAQAGLGVQGAVGGAVDMRLEYVYTDYNTFTNAYGRFIPRDNQVNLGIAYRLG